MVARFGRSHALEFVRYTGRTVHDCETLRAIGNEQFRLALVDEGRTFGVEWVFMRSLSLDRHLQTITAPLAPPDPFPTAPDAQPTIPIERSSLLKIVAKGMRL